MSLRVKSATPFDAAHIAALMQATWPDDSADVQRITRVLAAGQHSTLIGWLDDTPIGFADAFMSTSLDGTRRWELDLLAVHPDFRGRGIAAALVSQCTDIGAQQGAAWVRALTRQDNIAVHRVFAKCGYQVEMEQCVLAIADGIGQIYRPCAGCVPVETLTYSGAWFEGKLDPVALGAARRVTPQGDICGVLIPPGNGILSDLTGLGYTRIGEYRWWKHVF